MRKTAVIGGGAGGAEFARQFTGAAHARGFPGRCEVVIYDPKPRVGRGVAWAAEQSPLLMSNMPASTMATDPKKPNQIQLELAFDPESFEHIPYFPRDRIGRWLEDRFEETRSSAPSKGVDIHHQAEEVLAVRRIDSVFELTLASGRRDRVDQVVLAIGNVPRLHDAKFAKVANYHSDPWDLERLRRDIPLDSRILVVGAGLTAADIAIVMLSDPGRQPLVLASRSGLVPWVRPNYDAAAEPLHLTPSQIAAYRRRGGKICLRELQQLLESELRAGNVDQPELTRVRWLANQAPEATLRAGLAESDDMQIYFTALKRLDAVLPALWNVLDDDARRAIWHDWRSEHARISYAMSPINADRLLRAIEEDQLTIHGGLKEVDPAPDNDGFVATWADGSTTNYDTVISATGLGGPLELLESPLVRQMVAEGLLTPHEFAGARVTFSSGQVIGSDNRPIPDLFALAGPLTQGTHLFVNALLEVSKSATRTARAAVDSLLSQPPKAASPRLAFSSANEPELEAMAPAAAIHPPLSAAGK